MSAPDRNQGSAWVPFAYGFRPFFLLAGVYAVVSLVAWLWLWRTGSVPLQPLPPQYWHGHEMLFGFIGAAIAGFLLTAVPSWTGSRGFAGPRLVLLVLLWLAGRLVFFLGGVLPVPLLAIVELAFIPGLALLLAPSLLRSANRNWPMLVVLGAFWAADVVFIYGLASDDPMLSRIALRAALDLVLVLITIIGGRIVPAFTGNALRAAGADVALRSSKLVERLVIGLMLAYGVSDIVAGDNRVTAVVAALAAAVQLWRLSGWQGWRTGSQPIVWVLHVAYAWLPVGLALRAAWLFGGFGWAVHWQHAVMTRASLGHTGRPLQVPASIAAAYALLAASVLVRVFGPQVLPLDYAKVVLLAGVLWSVAFVVYLAVYTPILLRPRVDGKPG
ncbi:MAG: NnrS family protein [Woeseiaceae bacterium]